jgi:hypothetical protein
MSPTEIPVRILKVETTRDQERILSPPVGLLPLIWGWGPGCNPLLQLLWRKGDCGSRGFRVALLSAPHPPTPQPGGVSCPFKARGIVGAGSGILERNVAKRSTVVRVTSPPPAEGARRGGDAAPPFCTRTPHPTSRGKRRPRTRPGPLHVHPRKPDSMGRDPGGD